MINPLSSWRSVATATLLSATLLASAARAALTVTIFQSGTNVVATGSGSIALPAASSVDGFGTAAVVPSLGTILLGTPANDDQYNGIILGPDAFGPGGPFFASFSSGDYFGLDGAGNLIVPVDYLSGAPLSGSATWIGTTLAGLGLNQGLYLYTVADTGDTITVNVDATAPEPSATALLGLGLGLGFLGLILARGTILRRTEARR